MIPKGLLKENAFALSIVARFIDIIAVLIGAILAHWWRFDNVDINSSYRIAILLGIIFTPFIFNLFGIYHSWRGKNQLQHYRTVIVSWALVLFLLIIIAFLTKTSELFSRQWIVYWSIYSTIILITFRLVFTQILRIFRIQGWNSRKVAIFGAGDLGQVVIKNINNASWSGLHVEAFFDDNVELYNTVIGDVPVIGGVDELKNYIVNNTFDEIWITLPLRSENRVRFILEMLKYSTITIRYVPDIFAFHLLNHSVNEVAGIPVIDISSSPMVGWNRYLKAIEDRVLAFLIVIVISPVLIIVALVIKVTSSGPILFKQKRDGWDGQTIRIYKFRSMVSHVEMEGIITQAKKNDVRITKVGAFLRKTSLDELPQFFNVLQGRMSIVGPRPHAIAHNEQYKELIDSYMRRHKVKPGITGWAQINGFRGETDTLDKMKKRIEFDLFYIENWSLWFDLRIIFITIFKGFLDKNAR